MSYITEEFPRWLPSPVGWQQEQPSLSMLANYLQTVAAYKVEISQGSLHRPALWRGNFVGSSQTPDIDVLYLQDIGGRCLDFDVDLPNWFAEIKGKALPTE